MRTGLWIGFGAVLISAGIVSAAETTASVPILIEAEQLQKELHEKKLRVLDVRSQSEYAKGHIHGAVRADVGDWKKLATADGGLHDAKGWSKKVGPLGLTDGTRVVVYGTSLSDTSRIWWLLKYLGVENVSILNGGWERWTKEDRPIDKENPIISPTEFTPHFQSDRLAEMDSLKKSLKSDSVNVVDTRSNGEFRGGRIPGSTHLEWKDLVAKDGRFKTKAELQKLFRERGIVPSQTAVCY